MAGDVMLVAEGLARQAAKALSRSQDLWRQQAEVVEAIAVSEERIAATMARLADEHPNRAARLRAMSEQASSYATEIRQRDHALRHRNSRDSALDACSLTPDPPARL